MDSSICNIFSRKYTMLKIVKPKTSPKSQWYSGPLIRLEFLLQWKSTGLPKQAPLMRLQTLSNLFRIFLWDSQRPCVSVRSIKSKGWWNSRWNAAIQLTKHAVVRVQERNLPLCQWGSAEKLKSPGQQSEQSKLSIEKTTSTLFQITEPGKWCFIFTHTLCLFNAF